MTDALIADTLQTLSQQATEISSMSNIIPDSAGFDFNLVRIFRGILGMAVLIGVAWLFSNNRKAISWKMVGIGLLFQLLLAIGILYVPFIQTFFEFIGKGFVKILDFTNDGVTYLLKRNDTQKVDPAISNFCLHHPAHHHLLFRFFQLAVLSWDHPDFCQGLRLCFVPEPGPVGSGKPFGGRKHISGSDRVPLLIKPYLEKMSKSEILLVMSGGMATLAGGRAGRLHRVSRGDPVQQVVFAKHLLTASIMAAPGVVVISKSSCRKPSPSTDPSR
ncbi:MAG: Na+ dependent nucleoside transporter N-terminal domain-containing protein [Bacteroidales bacterium]